MGVAMAKLGTMVSVVEMMPQVMPGTEQEIMRVVDRRLKALGLDVRTRSVVEKAETKGSALVSTVKSEDGTQSVIESDIILVSVGKKASTEGLGLESAGVAVDRKGFIITDEQCRTNADWIFAVGDVTGAPFLAHRATAMGKVAAEVIAGQQSAMEQKAMPYAVFTDPEIAAVGLTQQEAEAQGIRVKVGKLPFSASGRATTFGENEGFVKIVAREDDDAVVGCQIVGKDSSELISEVALAIEMGATLDDIALTVHPHPTLPEAVMEAAEAANKRATHFIVR
jgi:dihydrolipoamide dehydrogenase